MDPLMELRNKIDAVDHQLMILLDQRMELSKKVGLIKQGQRVYQPDRERQILSYTNEFINAAQIQTIYQLIFQLSRELQG
jgi:chorismate mutase/prephenate dehydratase